MLVSSPKEDFSFTERKWGYFLKFTQNENSTVKILSVEKGKSISLQYHKNRTETWFVISGKLWVRNGKLSRVLLPGQSIKIPREAIHKLEGMEQSLVLEISKGIFDEDDIIRLDENNN